MLTDNSGRPNPSYILIALPDGERRFIPLAWTDQVAQVNYPRGACFVPERLLELRQQLDSLLVGVGEKAMLQAQSNEHKEQKESHGNHRTDPLGATESRTAGPHYRPSGADPAEASESTTGGEG